MSNSKQWKTTFLLPLHYRKLRNSSSSQTSDLSKLPASSRRNTEVFFKQFLTSSQRNGMQKEMTHVDAIQLEQLLSHCCETDNPESTERMNNHKIHIYKTEFTEYTEMTCVTLTCSNPQYLQTSLIAVKKNCVIVETYKFKISLVSRSSWLRIHSTFKQNAWKKKLHKLDLIQIHARLVLHIVCVNQVLDVHWTRWYLQRNIRSSTPNTQRKSLTGAVIQLFGWYIQSWVTNVVSPCIKLDILLKECPNLCTKRVYFKINPDLEMDYKRAKYYHGVLDE